MIPIISMSQEYFPSSIIVSTKRLANVEEYPFKEMLIQLVKNNEVVSKLYVATVEVDESNISWPGFIVDIQEEDFDLPVRFHFCRNLIIVSNLHKMEDGSAIWKVYCTSEDKQFNKMEIKSLLVHVHQVVFSLQQNQKKVNRVKRYLTHDIPKGEEVPIKPIFITDGVSISFSHKTNEDEVRQYTRHCEAWQVRGHYRHCKNGKVVFVKPFVKGHGKLKQSNYEVRRKNNDNIRH